MEFILLEFINLVVLSGKCIIVLFGGLGIVVVEFILSLVVDNGIILIINNGVYGKWMCEIVEIYKLNYIEFKSLFIDGIDLNELENEIRSYNINEK